MKLIYDISKEDYNEIDKMDFIDRTRLMNYIRSKKINIGKLTHDIIMRQPSFHMQEPKTVYISVDDVMSVFDDFMCGEVDEDGMNTFLEMLKDKAESED